MIPSFGPGKIILYSCQVFIDMNIRSFFLAFAIVAPWAISAPTSVRQEMHLSSRLNRTLTGRVAHSEAEMHHYLHRTFLLIT